MLVPKASPRLWWQRRSAATVALPPWTASAAGTGTVGCRFVVLFSREEPLSSREARRGFPNWSKHTLTRRLSRLLDYRRQVLVPVVAARVSRAKHHPALARRYAGIVNLLSRLKQVRMIAGLQVRHVIPTIVLVIVWALRIRATAEEPPLARDLRSFFADRFHRNRCCCSVVSP